MGILRMTGEPRVPSDTRAPAAAPAIGPLPPAPRPGVPVHLLVGHRSAADLAALLAAVSAHDGLVRHPLRWRMPARAGDLAAMAQQSALAARRDGGVVVAIGGDGTVHAATQACWPLDVALGVLADGAGSALGRQQGLPGDLPSALAALVRAIDRGQLRAVPVGQVNGQVFLVSAHLGPHPGLLAGARAGRQRLWALLAGVASLLLPPSGGALRLQARGADGRGHPRPGLAGTLVVAHHARPPAGPLPAGDRPPGALGARALAPRGAAALARLWWHAATGRRGADPAVDHFDCAALTVDWADPGPPRRRQVRVALDGDPTWLTLPLQFGLGTQPLWLLAPAHPCDDARPQPAAPQAVPLAAPPAPAHRAPPGRAWPA